MRGVYYPPLGSVKKVLNTESSSLPKQHTQLLAAGLLIHNKNALRIGVAK
jgi:hypothetical protein